MVSHEAHIPFSNAVIKKAADILWQLHKNALQDMNVAI
jgi:hypothetical protein